jgi:hypothetical protein
LGQHWHAPLQWLAPGAWWWPQGGAQGHDHRVVGDPTHKGVVLCQERRLLEHAAGAMALDRKHHRDVASRWFYDEQRRKQCQ